MKLTSLATRLAVAFALVLFVLLLLLTYRMQGPYRNYRVNLQVAANQPGPAAAELLQAGAGMRDITPDLAQYDSWTDADKDSHFNPDRQDTYRDRNGNGTFDFVWLGGFSSNRPAQGVHDPLWTRALALKSSGLLVVLVSIDCVGLTHERLIRLRKELEQHSPEIDYLLVASTHTHNSPDTMGIWSYHPVFSRFDKAYINRILDASREAVLEAVQNLKPVETTYRDIPIEPEFFVRASRPPKVVDRHLGAAWFRDAATGETVATLVSWGNHPEAMGGSNPFISSDFPHALRTGIENGLPDPNGHPGLDGICLYFQGPVGGIMTPLGLAVPDRQVPSRLYTENGPDKARALGENLALKVLENLTSSGARVMQRHDIAVAARTVFIPISGTYRIPIMLGLIHPGWFDGKARTEVAALRIGEIEILSIPGEIYPEIVDGGVECPDGADFPGPIQETPPLRSAMTGNLNLVFNLANDEVGYIIPRTQWDTQPPFTYGQDSAPYGEVNSGGVAVAPTLHREALEVLQTLHQMTTQ